MDEWDTVRVAELLHDDPITLRDDFMVSLVAEWHDRVVAVLRGWLGHPHGHIEVFHVDMMASPKQRITASVWLLRTFEGLLEGIGARGWTAMTHDDNHAMIRMLTTRGALALPGSHQVFVRRWR